MVELQSFFRSERNLAVCLGAVSDGLCVRDFDEEAAYGRWSTDHPAIARRLPTARTARGYHVFFNADVGDVRDLNPAGGSILVGHDGELKAGGYALLPQSIHPTGRRYEWVIEPNDVPYVGDILAAGLFPKKRNATQEIDRLWPESSVDSGRLDLTVDQAIECSQPSGHGERHFRIFDLCRMLKSTELASASETELRQVFERWFRLARPRIKTKRFQTSWREFLSSWPRVKRPFGATIAAIAERAKNDSSGALTIEELCAALQSTSGDEPFFLDCRTAGKVFGVNHVTAWRWLNHLVDTGRLELLKRGSRMIHRANECRVRFRCPAD